MRNTRLIFVEGIMGSGKSTTANYIARQVQRNGHPARYIPEGGAGTGNIVRMMSYLPHPFQPWLDLTTEAYREQSLAKWRAFVADAGRTDSVAVFDGQLFHGNMTDLLVMGAAPAELRAYVRDIVTVTRELNPTLIYFTQADVTQAIRRVFAARGAKWERYQADWKLAGPYGQRRSLVGLDGLIALYQDYRRVTDGLFADLDIPKMGIENSAGEWPRYRAEILAFLTLPYVEDTDTTW